VRSLLLALLVGFSLACAPAAVERRTWDGGDAAAPMLDASAPLPVLSGADAGVLDASSPIAATETDAATRADAAVTAAAAADAASDVQVANQPDAANDGAADAASQPDAAIDAAAVVAAPLPAGCISDVTPGQRELTCDGLSYLLSVPEACIGRACGLILDVHGGTMSARMQEKNTELGALSLRQGGYIVAQPNAVFGLFDAEVDDAKVRAFAEQLIGVFHIDRARVHMTGFSQGGYMTWRFICKHSDLLASAAPAAAAGEANISFEVDCSFSGGEVPARELDILYMHGRRDALVDFSNVEAKRAAVVARFGLTAVETLVDLPRYKRTRFSNARGTSFELIEHDYATDAAFPAQPPLGVAIVGHCYPGSDDLTVTEDGQLMAFGCLPPTDFTWGESVLAFFRAHPRAPASGP
jgi:hypothetical protein